ncbi:MAG: PAS domain S-box protein [Methanotrichaceae archaeon]
MAVDELSRRVSEFSERLEELKAKCAGSPANVSEILASVLESLQTGLKELLAAEDRLSRQNAITHLDEEKYRSIVETANEGIIIVDAEFRTTYVNDKFVEMLGYRPEEMIGKDIIDFYDKEYVAAALSKREHSRRNGAKDRFEFKLIRRDGSSLWVMVNTSPILDIDGEFAGSLGMFTDITERKRMEEELKMSEEKSRLLIKHAPSMIYEIDFRGPRFISVNDVMCSAMRYTRDELLAMNPLDLLEGECKNIFRDRIRKHLSGEKLSDSIEYAGRTKDGQIVYGLLNISFTHEDGRPVGAVVVAHDITERKQIETQLKDIAEKYSTLFNATSDGVWIHNLNGDILEVNDAYCRMSGYSRDELICMPISKLEAVEGPQEIIDRIRKIIEAGGHDRFESRHRRKDGSVYNVDITALYLGKDGGRMAIFVRDITERKRAEEALRESEEKFRIIADTSQASITLYQDCHVVYANKASEAIFGYSLDERCRMKLGELVHPDYRELEKKRMKALLEGETHISQNEYKIVRKDGAERWVLSSGSRLTYRGKPAVIVNSVDITERKRAELKLIEAIDRAEQNQLILDAVIQQMPAGVIITDASGLSAKNNEAMDRIWKREMLPIENIENHAYRAFHLDGSEYRLKEWPLTRALMNGEVTIGEQISILRGDGTKGIVHVSSTPIRDKNGKIIAGVVVDVDITEQKLMEEALRRAKDELELRVADRTAELKKTNDKLESINAKLIDEIKWHAKAEAELQAAKEEQEAINEKLQTEIDEHKKTEEELLAAKYAAEEAVRAKAAFLANMSHELRTPMNSIIGFTSLLLEEPLSPEHKDWIDNMRINGDALLALINDVLDFSKMEKEKIELELHPFDLRQRIEEALDLVSTKAAEKGLDIAYIMDSNVPETIISDSARLRQILANLLSNAVKFTDSGDVLVHVSSKPDGLGYELHFAVQDTGIGMPQDQISKLFAPFSQVKTSPRLNEGAGLGLAICKRLVELMGGKIWAESEEGKGSTFLFTIKAEAVPDKAARFPAGPQPKLAKRNVLIVDDNQTIRRLLGHQTKSWGMMPLVVSLSYSAIDLVQKGVVPDVAIIDAGMPDLNGIVLAEKIRRLRRDMPLIMLTTIGQHIPQNLSAVNLTKPIKPMQLYDALTSALAGYPIQEEDQTVNEIGTRTLRILLAEDNVSSQMITQGMLKKLGYRADMAANGIEVIQALERQPYDVVLMDIKMPEMDGFEATREIRQRWPCIGPRIIAITAYVSEDSKEMCIGAGMDGYIGKPVRMDELADALNKCSPLIYKK